MKSLKKQCDALWYEIIKKRAGYKSELTGREGRQIGGGFVICAHHIGGKPNHRLRYELDNGICLENGGEHKFGIHNPNREKEYREKIKAVKGEDIYERMLMLKHQRGTTDLQLVKIYLTKELEAL